MRLKKGLQVLGIALAFVLVLSACGGSQGSTTGFEHITGIEPGAGIMKATDQAISDYGLDLEVVPSSSASMAASLQSAIENEEWIVVTGWTPHWKFAAFDLKYLDDPEGSYGGEETINTMVRLGLEEEKPQAYQVLDNFFWTTDDMESIMLDIYENETDPRVAAQTWIDANRDKVDSWIEGVEHVDGEQLKLSYVAWDSEIASTNMIAIVL